MPPSRLITTGPAGFCHLCCDNWLLDFENMGAVQSKKPKLFIGSSSEGLGLARALHEHLAVVAEVTIWKDRHFNKGNESALDGLLRALDYFDFAVFALTPD